MLLLTKITVYTYVHIYIPKGRTTSYVTSLRLFPEHLQKEHDLNNVMMDNIRFPDGYMSHHTFKML